MALHNLLRLIRVIGEDNNQDSFPPAFPGEKLARNGLGTNTKSTFGADPARGTLGEEKCW